jgi:hypothetical protein
LKTADGIDGFRADRRQPRNRSLCLTALPSGFYGSGRESVKTFDLRGFSSCVQFDSRSRRRWRNVGTRVLCGFPSSEGGQNRCGRRCIIPPSERHFHSEAPVSRPFWRECVVWRSAERKQAPPGKPRRMHVLTDSRAEPILLNALDLTRGTHFTKDPEIGIVISILLIPVAVGFQRFMRWLGSRTDERVALACSCPAVDHACEAYRRVPVIFTGTVTDLGS